MLHYRRVSEGCLGVRHVDVLASTYARAHGSFFGCPAAAANLAGSKPVREGLGAMLAFLCELGRVGVVWTCVWRAMAVVSGD